MITNVMKEYRITAANILDKSAEDCHISPEDPVWDMLNTGPGQNLGSYIVNAQIVKHEVSENEKT